MTETAMLVLGFREPQVLRTSVPLYLSSGCDVYVHVDAKRQLADYVSQMGDIAERCSFVSNRQKVFWGGYSMIEAELALISAALSAKNYSRFCLVSDDSFPIMPSAKLRAFLAEPYERIALRKLGSNDPFLKRYTEHFILDHAVSSLLGRPIESTAVDEGFLAAFEALSQSRSRGKAELPIYYGSQWWSLTRKTILEIVTRLENDTRLRDSFRFSAVPDEILFQSLVGNTVENAQLRGGAVYVEWSKDPRPYVFKNANELSGLAPQYAFARKFSSAYPSAYHDLLASLK